MKEVYLDLLIYFIIYIGGIGSKILYDFKFSDRYNHYKKKYDKRFMNYKKAIIKGVPCEWDYIEENDEILIDEIKIYCPQCKTYFHSLYNDKQCDKKHIIKVTSKDFQEKINKKYYKEIPVEINPQAFFIL